MPADFSRNGSTGWLFDNWRPVGPFLYMAASNAVMVLLALLMLASSRRRALAGT